MVTLATEFEQVTFERLTIEAILTADNKSNSKMDNAQHDQSLHGKELLLKTSLTQIHKCTYWSNLHKHIHTTSFGHFRFSLYIRCHVYCHLYLACMYTMYPQLPVKKKEGCGLYHNSSIVFKSQKSRKWNRISHIINPRSGIHSSRITRGISNIHIVLLQLVPNITGVSPPNLWRAMGVSSHLEVSVNVSAWKWLSAYVGEESCVRPREDTLHWPSLHE